MNFKWIIPVLIMAVVSTATAQSLIGLPKEEVSRRISMYHREFRKDEMVVRQQFNYLKYVNQDRTRTWILYFNDENVCHISKLVCDYSEYDNVLDDLNSRYHKTDEFTWELTQDNQVNEVNLTRQEFYFTVRETKKGQGKSGSTNGDRD
jgi:hypothetical protein